MKFAHTLSLYCPLAYCKNWTGLDWIGFVKHGFRSEMMDK